MQTLIFVDGFQEMFHRPLNILLKFTFIVITLTFFKRLIPLVLLFCNLQGLDAPGQQSSYARPLLFRDEPDARFSRLSGETLTVGDPLARSSEPNIAQPGIPDSLVALAATPK